MNRGVSGRKQWLPAMLGCAIASAISFAWLDTSIAQHFQPTAHRFKLLEQYLQSTILILIEATIVAVLGFIWTLTRRFSYFWLTILIACSASILFYAGNALVLKLTFGVPGPSEVLRGADHDFHWLAGSIDSSFPSGHMVLAASFCGVFMQRYKRSIPALGAALILAAALLLLGNWHFLSDVIAGGAIGIFAGYAVATALPPMLEPGRSN